MRENIEDFLPKSLDEIVRRRRDEVQIRLATSSEIQALGEFLGDAQMKQGEEKDTINEWYPVTFRVRDDLQIRLLGHFEKRNEILLSSAVTVLNRQNGVARTENSLYRLGKRGDGEPPRHFLAVLCAILHKTGAGQVLGVPEVFF